MNDYTKTIKNIYNSLKVDYQKAYKEGTLKNFFLDNTKDYHIVFHKTNEMLDIIRVDGSRFTYLIKQNIIIIDNDFSYPVGKDTIKERVIIEFFNKELDCIHRFNSLSKLK